MKTELLGDSDYESDDDVDEIRAHKAEVKETLNFEYPRSQKVKKFIRHAFARMEEYIENMAEDIRYTGSTCTCVLIFGNKIYVANLGDSRTILVKTGNQKNVDYTDNCDFVQLSTDHNLKNDVERKRVIRNNGRIDAYRDKHGHCIGPERVWLQN